MRTAEIGIVFKSGNAASEIDKLKKGAKGVDDAFSFASLSADKLKTSIESMTSAGVKVKNITSDFSLIKNKIDSTSLSARQFQSSLSKIKSKKIEVRVLSYGIKPAKSAIDSIRAKTIKIRVISVGVSAVLNQLKSLKNKTLSVDFKSIGYQGIALNLNKITSLSVAAASAVSNIGSSVNFSSLLSGLTKVHEAISKVIALSSDANNALRRIAAGFSLGSINTEIVNLTGAVFGLNAQVSSMESRAGLAREQIGNFTTDITRMGNSSEIAGNKARGLVANLTAISGIVGIAVLTNSFIENTKEIERNAEAFDMSRQTTQVWGQAMKGVSKEGLDVSDVFKDISEKIGDFIVTSGGEAKDIFERLKLNLVDLRHQNPAEILQTITSKAEKMGNVSGKELRFLFENLANDASKLMPLLKGDGAALKAFQEQANKNYTILSNSQLDIVKKASGELVNLKQSVYGLGQQAGVAGSELITSFASPLASSFNAVAGYLSKSENRASALKMGFSALGAVTVPILALIVGGLVSATSAAIAFAFTPVGAIIVSLSAIVGAVIYFKDSLVDMGGTTASVMDWMLGAFDYASDGVKRFGRFLGILYNIVFSSQTPFEAMGGFISKLLDYGKFAINGLIGVFIGAANAFSYAWQTVPTAIKNIFIDIYNGVVGIMAKTIQGAIYPLNALVTAAGGAAIKVNTSFLEMKREAVDSSTSMKKAFVGAFDSDYVGDFGSAVSSAFSGIGSEIAEFADDRRLDRALDKASQSFDGLGLSAKKTTRTIKDYIAPVKATKEATKKLSAAQVNNKKAADQLVKSNNALSDSYNSKLKALKSEVFAFGKSEIQVYKYNLEQERLGDNNLKYSDSQLKVLIAEKSRVISLKATEDATKKTAEAAKLHKEAIDNIANSYFNEVQAARLDIIEQDQGVLKRVEAELSIKGITGALAEKLLAQKDESLALKESLKREDELVESRKLMVDSIEKESQEIRLSNIEITKGKIARFAAKLSIDGIKGAIAKKLIFDYKENKALALKNKEIKKSKDAREELKKKIASETIQLRLNKIEITKGKAARFAAKLSIDNVKGAIAEKLVFDYKENQLLLLKNKALEKTKELRKKVAESIAKQKEKLSLVILEYKKGKDAVFLADKATEKYTKTEALAALQTEKLTKNYEKKLAIRLKIKDAIKASTLALSVAIAVASGGVTAGEKVTLANEGWSASEIAKKQNTDKATAAIKAQTVVASKMSDAISDAVLSGKNDFSSLRDSIVDTFKNLVLRPSIEPVTKKIGSALSSLVGSVGDAFNGKGSVQGVMDVASKGISSIFAKTQTGIAGVFESFGTGSSLAGIAGANKTGQLAAGIGSAIGMSLGGPVGSAIGSALGGLVGNALGGKRPVRGTFGGEDSAGTGTYGTKRNKTGKKFKVESDFGYFGVRGGSRKVTSSLGRYKDGQIEAVMGFLQSIKKVDNAIASFLPASAVKKVKNSLKTFEVSTLNTKEVAQKRIAAIFSAMPKELAKLVDVNAPIEELVKRVNEIAAISNSTVPALVDLGLNLGNSKVQILENAVALSDASGGAAVFGAQVALFSQNFLDATDSGKIAAESLVADLSAMNAGLGLSGNSVITTKDQLLQHVKALNLNTDAGKKAFSTAMKYQNQLLAVSNTVSILTPEFMGLTRGMGGTRLEITETMIKLAGMAGGVEKLKTGLGDFYNEFYSQEERKSMTLVNSALAVDKYRSSLSKTDLRLLNEKGFRVYAESLDKTTESGRKAFIAALEVSKSMGAVSKSGQSLAQIMKSAPKGFIDFQKTMTSSTDKAANGIKKVGDASVIASPAINSVGRSLKRLATDAKAAVGTILSTSTAKPSSIRKADSADSLQKFALGGISNKRAIFGEAGAEAAVPLPDGRTIPVTMTFLNKDTPKKNEKGAEYFNDFSQTLNTNRQRISRLSLAYVLLNRFIRLGIRSADSYSESLLKVKNKLADSEGFTLFYYNMDNTKERLLDEVGFLAYIKGIDNTISAGVLFNEESKVVIESINAIIETESLLSETTLAANDSFIIANDAMKDIVEIFDLMSDASFDLAKIMRESASLIAQAVRDIRDAADAKDSGGGDDGSRIRVGGSYYSGLSSVPYDDFPANLHKGEAVVDAKSVLAIKRYFKADVPKNRVTRTDGNASPVINNITISPASNSSEIANQIVELKKEVVALKKINEDIRDYKKADQVSNKKAREQRDRQIDELKKQFAEQRSNNSERRIRESSLQRNVAYG